MSVPMKPNDPAYFMLSDSTPKSIKTAHSDRCYICRDPEFAQMGLPLCKFCPECTKKAGEDAGHVPADDVACTDCGFDVQEAYYQEQDKSNG